MNLAKASATGQQPVIKVIASDVDGTLLNSKQRLNPATVDAVKDSVQAGVPLFVATGKARGPWVKRVFGELDMKMPGVFLQGLLIYDAEGNKIFERTLPDDVVLDVAKVAADAGIPLVAFCGEHILSDKTNATTDKLKFYGEPDVEAMGSWEEGVVGKVTVNKLMFMGDAASYRAIRPKVEALLDGRASCTCAIEGWLEVLPMGANKGAGVMWLLDHLGVDAKNMMACGDGENDLEMLELAGLGVAMGNAGPKVKQAADVVVGTNDNDGVAEAIRKFVLAPAAVE